MTGITFYIGFSHHRFPQYYTCRLLSRLLNSFRISSTRLPNANNSTEFSTHSTKYSIDDDIYI